MFGLSAPEACVIVFILGALIGAVWTADLIDRDSSLDAIHRRRRP
jgi:hypothetical protein